MTQSSQQVNPWLTGVDFAITPFSDTYQPSYEHSLGAAAGGAGYSLSPDEAHDMLKQAKHALQRLMGLKSDAQVMKFVQPPAQDPASVAYNAKLASGSGVFNAGVDHIDTEIAYLNELIGKITESFKKITGHEPDVTDEITRAGQQPGSPETPKKGKL